MYYRSLGDNRPYNARTNASIIRENVKKQRALPVIPSVGHIWRRNKYERNTPPVIITYWTTYILTRKCRSDIYCILPFPSYIKRKQAVTVKTVDSKTLSDTPVKGDRDFGNVTVGTLTATCCSAYIPDSTCKRSSSCCLRSTLLCGSI